MTTLNEFVSFANRTTDAYFSKIDLSMIRPPELADGVMSYVRRGGKRFRPALVFICAGLSGGNDALSRAIPIACASELYHSSMLIHDDVIDDDSVRRGGPTVHVKTRDELLASSEASPENAVRYGTACAILSGDILFGASVSTICDSVNYGLDSATVLSVIRLLTHVCTQKLISGEALDTRYGLTLTKAEHLFAVSENEVITMMARKTGALFSFCTVSGYLAGLSNPSLVKESEMKALDLYGEYCGIAFQLKDDVLGIISDERSLGKPICNDIREAKNTLVLRYGYEHATSAEKKILSSVVGSKNASEDELNTAKEILIKRGGIEYAQKKAEEFISSATDCLNVLPDSVYKEVLRDIAHAMNSRNK